MTDRHGKGGERGAGYRDSGYELVSELLPAAVTTMLYQRLASDLDLSRNAQRYAVQGSLLTKPSIEVYSHLYTPLATLLWGLTPTASALAARSLLPTYCYFRIYQKDDICRVHGDRPACEHSMSLTLLLSDDQPWALTIEKARSEGPVAAIDKDFGESDYAELPMRAGDAVMYQGVNHRHGRLSPNPNEWSAHVFLHWVDPEGPHADHAFDRPALVANGMAPFR